MKLKNIVMTALLVIGTSAHADLKAEYSKASTTAKQKFMTEKEEAEAAAKRMARQRRMGQVSNHLREAGMNIRGIQIEFGEKSFSLCGGGGICGPAHETYYAKAGNTICLVRIVSMEDNKSDISHQCYDSTNPQATAEDQVNNIEIISQ